MKQRTVFFFSFRFYRRYGNSLALAFCLDRFRLFGSFKNLFTLRAVFKDYLVKRYFRKRRNSFVTLCDYVQHRRFHTSHLMVVVVQNAVQTGQRHTENPIGFCPRKSRREKVILFQTVKQVRHSLSDTLVCQGRNPKTFNRLRTAEIFIYVSENTLSLAPSVAGVYDLGNVISRK